MGKVTAIISAYNEENTIERVLKDLSKIIFINEIIVIDDGSLDKTREIIHKTSWSEKVKILYNEKNCGKGYSIARGLEVAIGELILILDGDIINYTESDLNLLVNPLLERQCDYTMKMTDNVNTKFLSGVRAYWHKDLASLVPEMKNTTRYGLEVLLNKRLSAKKGKFVILKDYKHFQKFEKYPLLKALWEYFKEGASILVQKLKQLEF